MNRMPKSITWTRRTIDRAISLWGLIQITRAAREVELCSPAKRCSECGEFVEVVVIPGDMCGSCWSKKVIATWRVLPTDAAVVRVGATARMRRHVKK